MEQKKFKIQHRQEAMEYMKEKLRCGLIKNGKNIWREHDRKFSIIDEKYSLLIQED